jgi:hypothetical protein
MTDFAYLHAIDCAGRAANRTAAILHYDLERGIASLKAITCLAPLAGAFGTTLLYTIALTRFYGMSAFDRGETAGSPADVFVLLALSLPPAIFACAGWHYLARRMAKLDLEMRLAALDLLNILARLRPARG